MKLYTVMTMLRSRAARRQVFERGTYQPLSFDGARREQLFGFARADGADRALLVVPRLASTLLPEVGVAPLGERVWGDTRIDLSSLNDSRPHYENVITGQCVEVQREDGRATLRAAQVFEHFPIALLH
jgi:(1->4)-alpha-D-glucan 1-alpha-D-glucosylmutase